MAQNTNRYIPSPAMVKLPPRVVPQIPSPPSPRPPPQAISSEELSAFKEVFQNNLWKDIDIDIKRFYISCAMKIVKYGFGSSIKSSNPLFYLSSIFIGEKLVVHVPDINIEHSGTKYFGRKYFIKNGNEKIFFGSGTITFKTRSFEADNIGAVWINELVVALEPEKVKILNYYDMHLPYNTCHKIFTQGNLSISLVNNLGFRIFTGYMNIHLNYHVPSQNKICPYLDIMTDELIGYLLPRGGQISLIINKDSAFLTQIIGGQIVSATTSNEKFWKLLLLNKEEFEKELNELFYPEDQTPLYIVEDEFEEVSNKRQKTEL